MGVGGQWSGQMLDDLPCIILVAPRTQVRMGNAVHRLPPAVLRNTSMFAREIIPQMGRKRKCLPTLRFLLALSGQAVYNPPGQCGEVTQGDRIILKGLSSL